MQTAEPHDATTASPPAEKQTSAEDTSVPLHENPRFKEVIDQKNEAMAKAERLEAQMEILREQATRNAPPATKPEPEPVLEDYFDERAKHEIAKNRKEMAEIKAQLAEFQASVGKQTVAQQIQREIAGGEFADPEAALEDLSMRYFAAQQTGREFNAKAEAEAAKKREETLLAKAGYVKKKAEVVEATESVVAGSGERPTFDATNELHPDNRPEFGTPERAAWDAKVSKSIFDKHRR